MQDSWLLDKDYIQGYLDFCKLAATDDNVFKNFKNNDYIKTIIENTNREWADKARRILINDGYGVVMPTETTKPTIVRYIYTSYLINKLIGFSECLKLIEIGAGYGGQCEILMSFGLVDDYTIYDLPEVQQLQQRYLGQQAINPVFINHISEAPQHDLCLSWCAWAELDRPTKELYAEKVISKAKHFFICSNYNSIEDKEILSKYFTDINEYSDELVMGVLWK